MKELKVIFMGTPEFSVPVLETLIKNCNVVMVVTQPDKLVGRKQVLTYSPIKEVALRENIPVFQPTKIRKEYEELLKVDADIIVTCAFGQLIPDEVLFNYKYHTINVHASLLPNLRGGAPIHHAIIDGYKETGITVMYTDSGMDDGDIIKKVVTPITEEDTVGSLHDRLMYMGPDLLIEVLNDIISGKVERTKQDPEKVTFGLNIKREEERIDFNKETIKVFNQIRGLNPFPSANMLVNGEEYKVFDIKYELGDFKGVPGEIIDITKEYISIRTLDGKINVYEIKPFGKKKMLVKDYLNGIKKEELLGVVVNG